MNGGGWDGEFVAVRLVGPGIFAWACAAFGAVGLSRSLALSISLTHFCWLQRAIPVLHSTS